MISTKTTTWILVGTFVAMLLGLMPPQVQGQATLDCPTGQIPVCSQQDDQGRCTLIVCRNIEDISIRGGAEYTGVADIRQVKSTLENIVGWIQVFFYIVATLTIVLAAWNYLTSQGDETKVKAAKNYVTYALVAIAIAIIAGGVVTLVRNFVG